jgi:hypothetical protein
MSNLIRTLDIIPDRISDLKSARGIPGQDVLRWMHKYFTTGYSNLTPLELFKIRQCIEMKDATYQEIETNFLYELMRMGFTDEAIEKFWLHKRRIAIGFSKLSLLTHYPLAAQKYNSWLTHLTFLPHGFREENVLPSSNDFRNLLPFLERNDLFVALHCLKTMREVHDPIYKYHVDNNILVLAENPTDGLLGIHAPALVSVVGQMCEREKIPWAPTTQSMKRVIDAARTNQEPWFVGKKQLKFNDSMHTLWTMRLYVLKAKGIWVRKTPLREKKNVEKV